MAIIITDRWGRETKNPDESSLEKTLSDLFIDKGLMDISITDGEYHLDIGNNKLVHLENEETVYYMKELEMEKIREIWCWFYEGKISYILAEPWVEGIPLFNGDW